MKIIKENEWHGTEITCPTCKSVIAYKDEDVKITHDYAGGSDEYIVCPVCNKWIYIH